MGKKYVNVGELKESCANRFDPDVCAVISELVAEIAVTVYPKKKVRKLIKDAKQQIADSLSEEAYWNNGMIPLEAFMEAFDTIFDQLESKVASSADTDEDTDSTETKTPPASQPLYSDDRRWKFEGLTN